MYYFPNTVWKLPDLRDDWSHFGVVIRSDHVSASILLCTHKEPSRGEPVVSIKGQPFDAGVTFVYLRKLKVVGLPITQKCKGNLSAPDLEEVVKQHLLYK